jgi:hypothetical protein
VLIFDSMPFVVSVSFGGGVMATFAARPVHPERPQLLDLKSHRVKLSSPAMPAGVPLMNSDTA